MRDPILGNRSSALPVKLAVKPCLFSGEPFGLLYSGVNRGLKP
jgi:hypothetical protein